MHSRPVEIQGLDELDVDLVWARPGKLTASDERAVREMMSPPELERNDRFRHQPSRRCHLVARLLVRTKLGELGDKPPAHWRFGTEKEGRPVLENPSPGLEELDFNIAHSHRAVVLALTRGARVGVDVEPLDRDVDYEGVARRFFHCSEREALEGLEAGRRRHRRFLELWVLKEAWMKADGRGIGAGLDEVIFAFDDAGVPELVDLPEGEPAGWRVALGEVEDHLLAVARYVRE